MFKMECFALKILCIRIDISYLICDILFSIFYVKSSFISILINLLYSPNTAMANELCMTNDALPTDFKFFQWATVSTLFVFKYVRSLLLFYDMLRYVRICYDTL